MYRCFQCNNVTEPNEPMNKRVTETKIMQHIDKEGRITGTGPQIKKEVALCRKCSGEIK